MYEIIAYILNYDGESPRLKDIPVIKKNSRFVSRRTAGVTPNTRSGSVHKYLSRGVTYSSTTISDDSGRIDRVKDSTT